MSQSQRSQNDDTNERSGSALNQAEYPNYDDDIGAFEVWRLESANAIPSPYGQSRQILTLLLTSSLTILSHKT
jgi:hypothetical protein